MKKEQKRGSDAGFSLIELLVAVAILAALSIPLLQGFIGTHNAAGKAALLQGATLAGQNLMETLHAHTVDEMIETYGAGEETEDGIRIAVRDIEQTGILYDALIDIRRGEDAATFAAPVTYDAAQDAVFIAQPVSGGARRKIVLNITAAGDTLSRITCMQYTGTQETEIHDEGGTDHDQVRNIFLIYPPAYTSTASTYDEATTEYADTIEIANPGAYPARIVIIKERSGSGNVAHLERAYRVRLKTVYPETERCEIYTNLNCNIAAGQDETGAYREKLIHQTLTDLNTRLLPLQGASQGAGSFYPVRVRVYPAEALSENAEAAPLVTLTNAEE